MEIEQDIVTPFDGTNCAALIYRLSLQIQNVLWRTHSYWLKIWISFYACNFIPTYFGIPTICLFQCCRRITVNTSFIYLHTACGHKGTLWSSYTHISLEPRTKLSRKPKVFMIDTRLYVSPWQVTFTIIMKSPIILPGMIQRRLILPIFNQTNGSTSQSIQLAELKFYCFKSVNSLYSQNVSYI